MPYGLHLSDKAFSTDMLQGEKYGTGTGLMQQQLA
jgi:hypothetical protein